MKLVDPRFLDFFDEKSHRAIGPVFSFPRESGRFSGGRDQAWDIMESVSHSDDPEHCEVLLLEDPKVSRAAARSIRSFLNATTKALELVGKDYLRAKHLQGKLVEWQQRALGAEKENRRLRVESEAIEARKEDALFLAIQDFQTWDVLERLAADGIDFGSMAQLKPIEIEALLKLSASGCLYFVSSRAFLEGGTKSLLESVCSRLIERL